MADDHKAFLPGARPAGSPDPALKRTNVTIGGRRFDVGHRTAAHLEVTFARFVERFPDAKLSIVQPCYHLGTDPSAHSHDFDGVIDFVVKDLRWLKAQRFLRLQGWAAWWRHTGDWEKEKDWHLHGVSMGCPGPVGDIVPRQVDDYHNKKDGLAAHGPDDTWHPKDIAATVFDYPRYLSIKEDAVPYTDWPKADQKALVKDVADAVLRAVVDGQHLTLAQASQQAARGPGMVRDLIDQLAKAPG
jgi:hypothetical protein